MGTALVGKPLLIRKFKYLRAAANLVGILVGEVPSAASALPSRAAAFMGGGRGLGWYAERRWEKAVVRYVTPGKDIPVASPHMPDCRGGVFAVFAKIPPPDITTSGVDIFCRNVAHRVAIHCSP